MSFVPELEASDQIDIGVQLKAGSEEQTTKKKKKKMGKLARCDERVSSE